MRILLFLPNFQSLVQIKPRLIGQILNLLRLVKAEIVIFCEPKQILVHEHILYHLQRLVEDGLFERREVCSLCGLEQAERGDFLG